MKGASEIKGLTSYFSGATPGITESEATQIKKHFQQYAQSAGESWPQSLLRLKTLQRQNLNLHLFPLIQNRMNQDLQTQTQEAYPILGLNVPAGQCHSVVDLFSTLSNCLRLRVAYPDDPDDGIPYTPPPDYNATFLPENEETGVYVRVLRGRGFYKTIETGCYTSPDLYTPVQSSLLRIPQTSTLISLTDGQLRIEGAGKSVDINLSTCGVMSPLERMTITSTSPIHTTCLTAFEPLWSPKNGWNVNPFHLNHWSNLTQEVPLITLSGLPIESPFTPLIADYEQLLNQSLPDLVQQSTLIGSTWALNLTAQLPTRYDEDMQTLSQSISDNTENFLDRFEPYSFSKIKKQAQLEAFWVNLLVAAGESALILLLAAMEGKKAKAWMAQKKAELF